ncbi:hypothetical protein [Flavobacterium sp.]|jgi:hypothetical protein|uniref:hypothetical protein n=1 Tax=Flavobacterium sp. TaxID=239 RepID=UPI0037C0BBBA
MKKILIVLIIGIFIGCNKKKSNDNAYLKKPFIISEFWKPILKYRKANRDTNSVYPSPPPLPIAGFSYGNNIFIIDKKTNIYYYQQEKINGFICGTGRINDTIPEFINLKPENIIEIPKGCIDDFIKLNIRKGERNRINIASQLDTLTFDSYYIMMKAINNTCNENDRDVYIVRRTTQEEDTVLKFVGNDKYYFPKEINWDKKRIKFKP